MVGRKPDRLMTRLIPEPPKPGPRPDEPPFPQPDPDPSPDPGPADPGLPRPIHLESLSGHAGFSPTPSHSELSKL